MIDGLAFGVMPEAPQALHRTHKLVALVHHPLAFETGLQEWEAAKFKASERLALSFAHRVITTSATTARLLAQNFAVPDGEDERGAAGQRPRAARRSGAAGDVVNLLAVGSIVPRKGYDLLIAALGKIADLPWRLVIAADPGRSPETAPRAGGADRLAASHRPRRACRRGVGRAAGGALRAAPTCSCCRRATKATAWPIPRRSRTACRWSGPPRARSRRRCRPAPACWCRPTMSSELTLALMRLIGNPAERARLTAGARAAAATLPTWDDAGRLFAQALDAGRMSGFSSEWLALREPYDLAARNATVLDAMLAAFRGQASISVVDLACGTGSTLAGDQRAAADAAELAAGRQRSRPARHGGDARAAAGRHRRGARDRSRARSRTGARRAGRPDHDVGAARSRLGGLARAAGDRSGGAAAAGLCGAQLRRARVVRSGRAVRRGDRRGGEPASARQQGIWPGARSGRGRERGGRSSSASAIRSSRDRPTGRSARPTRRSSARCCAALPMPPASSAIFRTAHIADWLARRLELVAAGASSMRVGHVDFFAMPMPIR